MRRLLPLLITLLVTSVALSGTVPAVAQDPEPTPEQTPQESPTASPRPSPNETSAPDEGNASKEEEDSTSESAGPPRNRTDNQTRDQAYDKAYKHYLDAWERYNKTRDDERQAYATFQDSAQRCKASEGSDRDACEEARRREAQWNRARERMEEARRDYATARAEYEQMRDQRTGSGPSERRPARCPAGERPTADGRCVRDRSPQPSPSARAEREEAYDRWQASRAENEKQHRKQLDNVSEEDRRGLGMCETQDAVIACRHVSFVVDPQENAIEDVTIQDTIVFASVVFPGPPVADDDGHGSNLVRIEGEDWRFLLSDGEAAPMRFRGDDDHPFLLTLTPGAEILEVQGGFRILVRDGDTELRAHLGGDVSRDATDPMTLVVHGDARFVVHGRSAVMQRLADENRPAMQEAIERGRLGAEVTVVKSEKAGGRPAPVVGETILYEDMRIELEEGAVLQDVPEERPVYTVTVDADAVSGRTIALSFQEGLLDPDTLTFRYFDVADDGTITEVTIIRATDLTDVLDPDDDGTVSEYWLVEDASGLQVLVSIPTFSVHKIELASLEVILKDPSLLIGLAGAAAVVTLSLIAIFRRPEEE